MNERPAPDPASVESPQPGAPISRRAFLRRFSTLVAAGAFAPKLLFPILTNGPMGENHPATAVPTESPTSTPTPSPTATELPPPTATEILRLEELVLAENSAVVDNPFDPNTMWEVAERFANGESVVVNGTKTDEKGNQYHNVTTKDKTKTGWILQNENQIPIERQKPDDEIISGRTSTLINPSNPFRFMAGPKEVEERHVLVNIVVEPDQDFTYYIRGNGTAATTIFDERALRSITVTPNSDNTVTIRVKGPSQQPDDKPITVFNDQTESFGVILQATRGTENDTLTAEPWIVDASTKQGDTVPKESVTIRGGFGGRSQRVSAIGKDSELTLSEMVVERGLLDGVTRQDLRLEYQRGGSIVEKTGQKIGIGEGIDGDEQFFGAKAHGGIQYVGVNYQKPGSRFITDTDTYRGTYEAEFQFNRLAELGIDTDFPIYLTKEGLELDQRSQKELLMDRDHVVDFLNKHPDLPVGLHIFEYTGVLKDSISSLSNSLYPDSRGQTSRDPLQTTINAIRFYNHLNNDPTYRDPITQEYSLRPIDIPLNINTTGAAIDPILSTLDEIKKAGDTYIRAIDISPSSLTEGEIKKLVAGLHKQGLLIRFNEVGRLQADGNPSPHTEASLQRLCGQIGVPIDIMGTSGYDQTMIHISDSRLSYNSTLPDLSPLPNSPYDLYLKAARNRN